MLGKLRNSNLHDLHAKQNIILMVKSSRMRWVAHETRMVKNGVYTVLVRNLRERDHLKDLRVDRSIILEWLVKIGWEDEKWTDLARFRGK